jgi:hypothetical protein
MNGHGGHRPIFPALCTLVWGDQGGFYVGLADDAAGPFPTIQAALTAAINPETKRAAPARAARIRKSTPIRQVQNAVYKTKRRVTRRKRG